MEDKAILKLDNTKDEIIRIYNEDDIYQGNDTRKNMRKNNLIHRCTDIVVCNSKGEILVQKRALTKEYCPGYLDAVIGGVVQEEDMEASAKREVHEEIGIDVDKTQKKLKFIDKYFFQEDICRDWSYCYFLELNVEEVKSITFLDHEVDSIEWIPKDKLYEMFNDPKVKFTKGSVQTILLFKSKGII